MAGVKVKLEISLIYTSALLLRAQIGKNAKFLLPLQNKKATWFPKVAIRQ